MFFKVLAPRARAARATGVASSSSMHQQPCMLQPSDPMVAKPSWRRRATDASEAMMFENIMRGEMAAHQPDILQRSGAL